ncbi:UDP-2,4-diacetamido-2,4,6-trideoxy-beta-L-altropyranose hydrolase [Clostridium sp. C8]|uniref:UDP-2,4-diacetamido-2,4, 6-trideoxy-beta-L-altropyranose hydrolase n=1 Tax=Clostridium sp. C8 TaxID=1667357 RepID=UPI00062E89D7|nr:UDP-2,4-diacetamido-2,4,6-trideoxy-beta-L-altropyranose hydrolase [Clostridium sp. C8]KLE14638.1 hypothetical protein AAT22_15680 [Clostridium sp. C8]
MYKVVIRADGGKELGLGHIMRTLVLAKELRKYLEVHYICKDDEILYGDGIKKVKDEGFNVIKINENNLISDIKKVQTEIEADLLITDSYDVDKNYFDEMKKIFKVSGYIDDINVCKLNVDFIINQNINATSIKYNTNKETKLFLGTEYCLLRDEFRGESHKLIKDKVENILITVGGTDKDYITLKILDLVLNYDSIIHVVIGSAFEEKLINEIYKKYGYNPKVKLYKNAKMAELMKLCDIAISSCGSTLYELSAMKVPAIGITVADNQIEIGREFSKRELIIGTNNLIYQDINRFNEVINALIVNKKKRQLLSQNQKKLVNVNGAKILVENILVNSRSKDDVNGVY